MIARLAGTLLERRPPNLLIDVGGVGYEVEAPMSVFAASKAHDVLGEARVTIVGIPEGDVELVENRPPIASRSQSLLDLVEQLLAVRVPFLGQGFLVGAPKVGGDE